MKEQFIDWRPQKKNRILLEQCQAIAEEYSSDEARAVLTNVFTDDVLKKLFGEV